MALFSASTSCLQRFHRSHANHDASGWLPGHCETSSSRQDRVVLYVYLCDLGLIRVEQVHLMVAQYKLILARRRERLHHLERSQLFPAGAHVVQLHLTARVERDEYFAAHHFESIRDRNDTCWDRHDVIDCVTLVAPSPADKASRAVFVVDSYKNSLVIMTDEGADGSSSFMILYIERLDRVVAVFYRQEVAVLEVDAPSSISAADRVPSSHSHRMTMIARTVSGSVPCDVNVSGRCLLHCLELTGKRVARRVRCRTGAAVERWVG
mmetsp:Transcript_31474/g.100738  ORF Transcript_31474/g.100738 Transcript_31474/m.100738 type:complete len:266 (+) Transcript_31474:190-987(+)